MDYLFGSMRVDGVMRRAARIKTAPGEAAPEYQPGTYHTHIESYPDVELTDSFKVDRLLQTSTDSEGNAYAWYVLSEYSRNIDRSPSAEAKAGEALDVANAAQTVNGITFVTLAEAGSIDAVTAGEHAELFVEWSGEGVQYETGQLRRYNDKLYRCVQAHKSQPDWSPEAAANLWAKTSDPAEEWPEWSRPVGAHDAYNLGDKVSYKGKHYQSNCAANVWAPDEYGWDEVSD